MRYQFSYSSLSFIQTVFCDQLRKFDVPFKQLGNGMVEVAEDMQLELFQMVKVSLGKYGIELLSDERSQLVQHIKNILIETVYGDRQPITLSILLSENLGQSYGYLSNIFEDNTLTTIEQYLIFLRIERAKRLITEELFSNKEISSLLKYSSVGHFSKQFRKHTGLTLTMYKNIIQGKKGRQSRKRILGNDFQESTKF